MLKLTGETQTVVVFDDSAAPVINTEVSNVAETKVGDELVELPVAIYSRSTGSTSPISTLTTEAGVQTDDSGNLAVLGTTAALLSVTIDGISSVGVEYSGPVNEMFPSFNSIEEIRVSESNNNAEFSGVADITTVSKAGTINYHGGVFENHENTVLNANDPFALSKPKIIMNDFGGTLGGPVRIPHFTGGQPSTFFFASYEGLRLPRETPIVLSVPSSDMRKGNVAAYLAGQGISAIYQPDGVTPIDPTSVPVSPVAAKVLQYLFPEPNNGSGSSYTNNYQINFPSPISANQGDIRLDRTISSKQTAFARFSYKNRQVTTAPSALCTFTYCAEAGSPLQGAYNTPEIDEGLTFAYNYVFTPAMLNEFRGGFNAQHTSEEQSYSTTTLLNQTGFTVPQPDVQYSEAPQVLINGFMSTGAGNPGVQRGQIIELLDNLTWTHKRHTLKFGADFRRLTDHDDNVFGNYRSGWYVFDGSSDVGSAIGDPYTAFLLGFPDYTSVSSTNNPTMDGIGYSYAFYGQDDWKIRSNLTLNLGLRYELHPPMRESHSNTAAFMPDWTGIGSDGSTSVNGAVVVSDNRGLSMASQDFAAAIAPTPIITAAEATFHRHCDLLITPISGRASALPGARMVKTRPFCAADGVALSSRRSASRLSPVGRSHPATSRPTTRIINLTALLRCWISPIPSTPPPAARTARLVSTMRSPSTTRSRRSSSGTSPSSRTLATASACASLTRAAAARIWRRWSISTRSNPTRWDTRSLRPTFRTPRGASFKAWPTPPKATTTPALPRYPDTLAKGLRSTQVIRGRATYPMPAGPRPARLPWPGAAISPTAFIPDSTTATSSTIANTAFLPPGFMISLSEKTGVGSRPLVRLTNWLAGGNSPG